MDLASRTWVLLDLSLCNYQKRAWYSNRTSRHVTNIANLVADDYEGRTLAGKFAIYAAKRSSCSKTNIGPGTLVTAAFMVRGRNRLPQVRLVIRSYGRCCFPFFATILFFLQVRFRTHVKDFQTRHPFSTVVADFF
jgi:hypothetical protein